MRYWWVSDRGFRSCLRRSLTHGYIPSPLKRLVNLATDGEDAVATSELCGFDMRVGLNMVGTRFLSDAARRRRGVFSVENGSVWDGCGFGRFRTEIGRVFEAQMPPQLTGSTWLRFMCFRVCISTDGKRHRCGPFPCDLFEGAATQYVVPSWGITY